MLERCVQRINLRLLGEKIGFDRQRRLDISALMSIHSFVYHISYIYLKHPIGIQRNLDAENIF